MKVIIRNICYLLIASSFFNAAYANADSKKVGFGEFKKNRLQAGETVCEPLDSEGQNFQCYYFNNFDLSISKTDDPSGILKEKSVGQQQSALTKAEVFDLITQKEIKDFTPNQQPVPFYVKVHWEGNKGTLGIELKGTHLIQGKIIYNETSKKFEVNLERLPDMMIGDFFMPEMDIAEIFGRNVGTESDTLKEEMMNWLEKLIKSPIENYLNQDTRTSERLP
jgi:hypothetical protein